MADPKYMHRCLHLASLGLGHVSPNPLVGAVLVHEDKIIGEGWHRKFGEAHAEVNAINDAIRSGQEDLLSRATLYVNLEPCVHHGKTPPCTDLILEKRIPEVVMGMRDPFAEVAGKGYRKLVDAGVKVSEMLPGECREMNKRFVTFHEHKRPWIILKYAQTHDGFIAPAAAKEIHRISGPAAHRLVHKWRTEEDTVMVGFNTAKKDNPQLTVRMWEGRNPVRIVVDPKLELPATLHLFDNSTPTLVLNTRKSGRQEMLEYAQYDEGQSLPEQICRMLHDRNIQSVILEGGLRLMQEFINENYWDEARVFTAPSQLGEGVSAPFFHGIKSLQTFADNDELCIYSRI